jgi:hypothetical protein
MISALTGNLWNTGMLTGIRNCPPIRVVRYTYPYGVAHIASVVVTVPLWARVGASQECPSAAVYGVTGESIIPDDAVKLPYESGGLFVG